LVETGIIRRALDGVRVLNKGEITSSVTISVTGASAAAIEAVAAAGGTLTVAPTLEPHGKSKRKAV
jgi:large subunit ribosomal protein L15